MTVDQYGITKLYPTTGGGLEWFSNWESGSSLRYVSTDTYDATDADFGVTIGLNRDKRLRIRDGHCKIKRYGEYRLFVDGPWTNTEMTIFARIKDTTTSSIQLRSRANHHGVGLEPFSGDVLHVDVNPQGVEDYISCGFGNYFAEWGNAYPIDFVSIGLEIIHELYTPALSADSVTIPNDDWIGYKLVTRTLANGHVKLEAYNNFNADKTTWDLVTYYDFDGSNAAVTGPSLTYWQDYTTWCTGKGDNLAPNVNSHQLFTGSAKWNFVRINTASKVDLKYYSVREIVPF